jgi:hypothetical protein
MSCIFCGRGFHDECESECEECHPEPVYQPQLIKLGRPEKEYHEITDPKSTGRKRAARDYPITKGEPCEWRGLKNCGGGLEPIIGCLEGNQSHRHHGPIKDPRHNEEGNVHRICPKCHRRWHARNDPVYDAATFSGLPHRPLEATSTELAQNELNWKKGTSEFSEAKP